MTTSQAPAGGSAALPLGFKLDEYRISAVLGQGGFGITYRGHDTRLGADVAIKEYFPQVYAARTRSATIVPRTGAAFDDYKWGLAEFLKEAQALARFKHAHIVRVLRFLEANGTAYMVMEYEEGATLSAHLQKHGGMPDEASLLRVFLPILDGLQAVHDAGLLHLDIKPGNIYLRSNGQPMLIDFGSSRRMRTEGDTPQKVMLTQGYCAPEQYPGHGDIGTWSDLYGIGASLYRCITGKTPVDALERHDTFARSRIDPLRPATTIERPFYSAHIRRCVDAALGLKPGDRPASAFALQQGLMGKDMSTVEKRAPAVVFRPGSGYIGVIPAAPQEQKRRRRYSTFEKLVATAVFVGSMAVVVPKLMLDTGQVSEEELYGWISDQTAAIETGARDLGDFINERVFGKRATPKVAAAPAPRPGAEEPAPAAAPPEPEPPYGTGMRQALEIAPPEAALVALGFLKHGTILATATDDGRVQLRDLQTGETRAALPARVRTAAALGVFPSSQGLAVTGYDDRIVILDPLGNRESELASDSPHPVTAIAVSADNRLLAEADEGDTVTIWELSQNRRLREIRTGGRNTQALVFSPDEQLLAVGSADGSLGIWRTGSGEPHSRRIAHERGVTALAFSRDGRWIASAGASGQIQLWSAGDETASRAIADPPKAVRGLAFSRDGKWLIAAGGDRAIGVWSTQTGEPAHRWAAHERKIKALAVSPDGRRIATADEDNRIRIWE
jgi:serine/threonine protein kinase